MKLFLPYIFLLFSTINIIAQNLENNSFENWSIVNAADGSFLYEELDGYWVSNNLVSTINSETNPFVTRETNLVQDGENSIRLESGFLVGFGGGLPVGAVCGVGEFELNFIDQANSYKPGMPFTSRPEMLSGYYIYQPVDIDDEGTIIKDACEIYTYLTKFNTNTNKRDTLGVAYFSTEASNSEFEFLQIPFEYYSTETPDTMFTVFAASKAAAPPLYHAGIGTTLIIDNFELDYETGISAPLVPLYEVNVFPNPAQDFLQVAVNTAKEMSFTIFNIEGKKLKTAYLNGNENTIDIRELMQGMYVYQIHEAGKVVAGGQFQVK